MHGQGMVGNEWNSQPSPCEDLKMQARSLARDVAVLWNKNIQEDWEMEAWRTRH